MASTKTSRGKKAVNVPSTISSGSENEDTNDVSENMDEDDDDVIMS